jgi:microcystin-dependent protein
MPGVFQWSQTANLNSGSDPSVGFSEGQNPGSLNDGCRALMASVARYRDDTSGSIVTGGTSTAYTVTSSQGFLSKALMNGAEISFTVHATNGVNPTLSVDFLGGDPISLDGTNPIPVGSMIAGSVYSAVYYNSGNSWRVKDFYVNAFNIPLGGCMDFFCPAVPNSNFVFPIGQAISRTTYAALFGLVGTTYGVGDGSTTFNVPDLTGRVTAMKEAAASRLTSSYFGGNSTVLGAVGGLESHTLTTAELPAHSHANTLADPQHTHAGNSLMEQGTGSYLGNVSTGVAPGSNNGTPFSANPGITIGSASTGISITNANAGSGNPHAIVQPTIICNKIFRIL